MPIYAYRCNDCGFSQDILQKISDPVLTSCPSCGKSEFKKQVTAAGFQLKGSGWYATDFKGSGTAPAASNSADKDSTAASKTESTSTADTTNSTSIAKPTNPTDSTSAA